LILREVGWRINVLIWAEAVNFHLLRLKGSAIMNADRYGEITAPVVFARSVA